MTGRLSVPAQMSAPGRVRTAGPDALPLWQNEQGPCLQNHTEAASQQFVWTCLMLSSLQLQAWLKACAEKRTA